MKIVFFILALLSTETFAEGYYYPLPANPPAYIYALPPAYVVPPQKTYIPPPLYIPPIQRGYYPPPPDGWVNSKITPLPPKVNLYPQGDK